jgi:hypothetical protein
MNLTDLREELTARAAESDEHPSDLLVGVHRKIVRAKRRRVAGVLVGTAVVAALAIGVLPGLTDTSTPDPAVTPTVPADYTKDGLTLHGQVGSDLLEKAWIGRPGQDRLEFVWTPTRTEISLYTFCRSSGLVMTSVRVQLNGHRATEQACNDASDSPDPANGIALRADSSVWLDAPVGKPARVTVTLVDAQGRELNDPATQLALGIYDTGKHQPDGPPTQTPPTSAEDYVKDGIRYRAKVGGDSLAAAVIGSPGQASLKLKFTATGARISLRNFCTANDDLYGNPQYQVAVNLSSGVEEKMSSCDSQSTDAGGVGQLTISVPGMVGRVVEATVTLRDGRGRPVSMPGVRIGLGIYRPGAQRIIGGSGDQQVSLDEVTEYGGYLYKLSDVRTVDAKTTDHLDIATPEGKPFLVAYGSTDLGAATVKGTVTGLSPTGGGYGGSAEHGIGMGLVGEAARKAGTATLTVTGGKPTGGKLLLGIYVPES